MRTLYVVATWCSLIRCEVKIIMPLLSLDIENGGCFVIRGVTELNSSGLLGSVMV